MIYAALLEAVHGLCNTTVQIIQMIQVFSTSVSVKSLSKLRSQTMLMQEPRFINMVVATSV